MSVGQLSLFDLLGPRTPSSQRELLGGWESRFDQQHLTLLTTLELAVPMWQNQWARPFTPRNKQARLESPTVKCSNERCAPAGHTLATMVASHGDDLQYGGKNCAATFNALAEGVAICSFAPGGVRFAGRVWQAPFRLRHPDDLDDWEREHRRNHDVPGTVPISGEVG